YLPQTIARQVPCPHRRAFRRHGRGSGYFGKEGRVRMGRIFEKRKHSIFKTAAQNSKLYSKYSKQLYMAAKKGVPDPDANPVLRSFVERAKRENVPSHVIDKAIQKAAGTGGEDFQPVRYEGFGP